LLKNIELDPKSELGRYYLGQVYIAQGKKNNARKLVDELKSMNSSYAEKLQKALEG
jgi:hypothetical protein